MIPKTVTQLFSDLFHKKTDMYVFLVLHMRNFVAATAALSALFVE